MSEEIVTAPVVTDAVVVAPKPRGRPPKAAPDVLLPYKTAKESSVLFDVQVSNEWIYGQWDSDRKHVLFFVPERLADGFEGHWHFTTGKVIEG